MVDDFGGKLVAADTAALVDERQVVALALAVLRGHEGVDDGEVLRKTELDHFFLRRAD